MIIDIAIILAFTVCVFLGAKKGFAKTVLGFCSYIVSVIAGIIFYDEFLDFLYSNAVSAGKIEEYREKITEKITGYMLSHGENVPAIFKKSLETATGDVAASIGEIAVETVVAVLFFVGIVILVKVLAKIITMVVKLPVLKQFNGLLGGAMGAVNGVIVCYILGAVVMFMFINSGSEWITKQLEVSALGGYFFKNNFLLNLLVGI